MGGERGGIVRRLPSTVGGEEEQCVGGMGGGWGDAAQAGLRMNSMFDWNCNCSFN